METLKDDKTRTSALFERKIARRDNELVKLQQELALTKIELNKANKQANDHFELCKSIVDQRKKAKDTYFINYANALKYPDATYSQLVDFTIAKLESHLDCPLTMDQIAVPVVLPCGKT